MGCTGGAQIDFAVAYNLPATGDYLNPITSDDIKMCQLSWEIVTSGKANTFEEDCIDPVVKPFPEGRPAK